MLKTCKEVLKNGESTGSTLEVSEIKKLINISKEVLGEDNILTILFFGSQSMNTNNEWGKEVIEYGAHA